MVMSLAFYVLYGIIKSSSIWMLGFFTNPTKFCEVFIKEHVRSSNRLTQLWSTFSCSNFGCCLNQHHGLE
ncbi:hypothetical protein SNEBB_011076 [Seison nebaliae]|nr:hypothetical protein SNEBB_011076 [Seison nebaliae]